jgi:hypothetical protein
LMPFRVIKYIFNVKEITVYGSWENIRSTCYFTKTPCTCLFIWEHVGASVRLVHPRTWFKHLVANYFATDCSKAVTPRVLFFVNFLWCLIWNWYSYTCKHMFSFPLHFIAAWGGCVFWVWWFLICIFHF